MAERTAEWLDEAVDKAREVCQGGQPKERSAVQTLLQFAKQTESVKELVLFIRYQGARASQRQQGFYDSVAEAVEQRYAQNVQDARAFLGLVVRAHRVAGRRNGGRGGPGQQRAGRQRQGGSRR